MGRYKLSDSRNKEPLKEEDIRKYKNFGKLIYAYQKATQPPFGYHTLKNKWVAISFLIIFILLLIILLENN